MLNTLFNRCLHFASWSHYYWFAILFIVSSFYVQAQEDGVLRDDILGRKPKYLVGLHTDIFVHQLVDPKLRFGVLVDAPRDALIVDATFGVNIEDHPDYKWKGAAIEYNRYVLRNAFVGCRLEHYDTQRTYSNEGFSQNGQRFLVDRTTQKIERNAVFIKLGYRYRKKRFYMEGGVGLGIGRRDIRYVDNVNLRPTMEEEECAWFSCEDLKDAGQRNVFAPHFGGRFGIFLHRPSYDKILVK